MSQPTSELIETEGDTRAFDLDGDRLREECGVFGIFGHPDAAAITALGLHALQHRGQEAAGIVSFDGKRFHSERRMGLVGDNFSRREVIDRLPGTSAVGHVRYSTTGETILRNVQPLFAELEGGGFAIGHNGNLTNGLTLRRQLVRDGAMMQSTTDTEVILHLVARAKRNRFIDRFIEGLRALEGAYAFVGLTNKKLIGARDPLGIRPLVIGELDGCPILASETCALDIIGAKYVRDVENGEVVVFDEDGTQSHKPFPPMAPRPCIFEYIYFARPDSIVGGRPVYDVRKTMGGELAREAPATADVVVPVPDSGVPAAIGYAQASGIPYELGIIRNHYVGRTFIEPTQHIRQLGVRLKHSANRAVVNGKRIVLVDDSIVRGTTSVKIVQMMRDAGAREVHMRIASPPITHSDYYGIDTPERDKLLAATHDLEGMRALHRRRLARLPVGRRHLSRHGLRAARSGAAAVHRPLLHRRLSDPAHRPERARGAAAAIVAARRGELTRSVIPQARTARARALGRNDGPRSCPCPSPTASRSSPAPRAGSAMRRRSRWRRRAPMSSRSRAPSAGSRSSTTRSGRSAAPPRWCRSTSRTTTASTGSALALHERFGRLDILVGNAGILGPLSPLGHVEAKAWDEVMAVNVTANWRLICAVDPLLKFSDAGRAGLPLLGRHRAGAGLLGSLRHLQGRARGAGAHLCGGNQHRPTCASTCSTPGRCARACAPRRCRARTR